MLISVFRKSNPYNAVLLLAITVLLRLSLVFNPAAYSSIVYYHGSQNYISKFFLPEIFTHIIPNVFITGLIVFAQAIIFGIIMTKNNLFSKATLIPELLYMVASSGFTPFLVFSPALLCNFALLWVLAKILDLYKAPSAVSLSFDTGFIVGLASLLYLHFLCIFPLLWIGLRIFRSFIWREWVLGLIGVAIPYIFMVSWYIITDNHKMIFAITEPFYFQIPDILLLSAYDYFLLLPVAVIALLVINQIRIIYFKRVIFVRKSINIFAFLIVIILTSYFVLPNTNITYLMFTAAPLSVFFSYYFIEAKRPWIYESMFGLIILLILYFQLF